MSAPVSAQPPSEDQWVVAWRGLDDDGNFIEGRIHGVKTRDTAARVAAYRNGLYNTRCTYWAEPLHTFVANSTPYPLPAAEADHESALLTTNVRREPSPRP